MARTPIHPGEILADELEEIGLSAKKLADVIDLARRQVGKEIQRIPRRSKMPVIVRPVRM